MLIVDVSWMSETAVFASKIQLVLHATIRRCVSAIHQMRGEYYTGCEDSIPCCHLLILAIAVVFRYDLRRDFDNHLKTCNHLSLRCA